MFPRIVNTVAYQSHVALYYRCSLPGYANDSYQPMSDLHNQSIYQWIPTDEEGNLKSCEIYGGNITDAPSDCHSYVFDHSDYWGSSLNMQVIVQICR